MKTVILVPGVLSLEETAIMATANRDGVGYKIGEKTLDGHRLYIAENENELTNDFRRMPKQPEGVKHEFKYR